MKPSDHTSNDERAHRIIKMALARGWSLYETVRFAVATGYLAAHWADEEKREREAGIATAMNTTPGSMEDENDGE
jgi:hypothetical protein